MIDGLVSIVVALYQAIGNLFSALVHFIASFFVSAGQTLTAMDLFLLLLVLILELCAWILLGIKEIVCSLLQLRKPRSVKRPVLWRPKKKARISQVEFTENKV